MCGDRDENVILYQVRAEEAFITQRSGTLAEAAGELKLVFKQSPQP